MQLQLARLHSPLQRLPKFDCLALTFAVADHIVGVALECHAGVVLAHPAVKRVVKEEIGQQRADNPALGRAAICLDDFPSGHLHAGFEPALDVQQRPSAVGVLAHRAHHQLVIDVVEEAFDVQIKHPVLAPAALARHAQCLVR